VRGSVALVLAVLVLGAVAITTSLGTGRTRRSPTPTGLPSEAISDVFRDWFTHGGRFTQTHLCGPVQEALIRANGVTDAPNPAFSSDLAALRIVSCRR
jgi:hypothetical protein